MTFITYLDNSIIVYKMYLMFNQINVFKPFIISSSGSVIVFL